MPKVSDERWEQLATALAEEWIIAAEFMLGEEGVTDIMDAASLMCAAAERVNVSSKFAYKAARQLDFDADKISKLADLLEAMTK